jgi:GNAT superfamily N-acetyltransferase
MLSNESSFDKLFCDVASFAKFNLYYNQEFSEDPVFNHSLISESVLNETFPEGQDSIDELLHEIRLQSSSRHVPATVFLEKFWKNARIVERNAVEFGCIISGSMNVLSKKVVKSNPTVSGDLKFSETNDVELWNDTFMNSFSISPRWEKELLKRLEAFSPSEMTTLLLATDKNGSASGCLLLHRTPPELMGVYCVGTLPHKRNRGVATFMMKQAEELAGSAGCQNLTLQTIVSDGTTPLYLKLGYNVEFERNILRFPQF